MRVLVCGGRDYDDIYRVEKELLPLGEGGDWPVTIVHGAARGADRLAGESARGLGYEVEEYPADWRKHGKAAGPIRNQQMLDTGIDLVIAFPGGRGTADMVERARRAGVEVHEVLA